MAKGRFREDLYFRLAVVRLRIPPLRERPADILPLAGYFAERYAQANGLPKRPLSPEAEAMLLRHPWPGNVRELENAIHRAVLLATGSTIALDAARARGIAVCNMPGSNAQAVAEMTLLLMLACLRRLPMLDRAIRAGQGWKIDPAMQDNYGELKGRTVGLVGFGSIPQSLAPALRALGAEVIYTATGPKAGHESAYRSLPDLLRTADIVSLHIPLTPATTALLGAKEVAVMKPGAILVNTARCGLVDQKALYEALLGSEQGPRMGSFIALYGVENSRTLIAEALAKATA